MTVQVRLFARAKDLAGQDALVLTLPAGASLRDLKQALLTACPALQPLLLHLLFAVNNDYVDERYTFTASADVACFPPVSGG